MNKNTIELTCANCGEIFIYKYNPNHAPNHVPNSKPDTKSVPAPNSLPTYCPSCHSAMKKAREQQIEAEKQWIADEEWRRQNLADRKRFEEQLLQTVTVPIEDLRPQGRTLYIIGNGFDLMHGVKSSYRAFRDFLGKNSDLRFYLECYLKPEDIWADFEEALGHINMDMMANPYTVGDMLDLAGFFDEDAGMAEYCMALEMAAEPMQSITEDLDKRFRAWVEKLEPGTNDRPLKSLIHDDRVLCFNYTEFVETFYGVSEPNICYIHGCRKQKKGCRKDKLILGHKPGASEKEYELIRGLRRKKSYRSQVIDVAQEGVVRLLSEYDEDLTKDSQSIIAAHRPFFDGLTNVEDVVVIGHSISPVDWDYFLEVAKTAPGARWYFGCHGIHDLENTMRLADALGIDPVVFRTDGIFVTRIPEPAKTVQVHKPNPKKIKSPDQNWTVRWLGRRISIAGENGQITRILRENIRRCVFSPSGDILFVIINGLDAGIPFFRLIDGVWVYIDEMEPVPNQNLLNRRLQHVYLSDRKIIFVYNNRVREYSLETGQLLRNQAKRDARNGCYEGEEIKAMLVPDLLHTSKSSK